VQNHSPQQLLSLEFSTELTSQKQSTGELCEVLMMARNTGSTGDDDKSSQSTLTRRNALKAFAVVGVGASAGCNGMGPTTDVTTSPAAIEGDGHTDRIYSIERSVVQTGDTCFAEAHSVVAGPETVSDSPIGQQAVTFLTSYTDEYDLPSSKNAEIRVIPKRTPGSYQYSIGDLSVYTQGGQGDSGFSPNLLNVSWSELLCQSIGIPQPFGFASYSDPPVRISGRPRELRVAISTGRLHGMEWSTDLFGPKGEYEFEIIFERDVGYWEFSPKTGAHFWVPVGHVKHQHDITFTRK
jgi:hypothetical protein